MNEIKNLLAANRKALQGLHTIANMDFQQPFVILERDGNFTYNSILKELNGTSYNSKSKLCNKINTDDYNIFVLYKRTDYSCYRDLYLARLSHNKFETERKTIENYEAVNGWRWLDTSTGKDMFEKARKSATGHYYIIAQEKQYANKRSPAHDNTERYRVHMRDRKHIEAATPYYYNSDKYYDNILGYYDRRTLDKSGYIQQVNDYERRVKVLKSQRSAAAAAVWDNAEKYAEIETRILKINTRIAELTNAPVHEIPYMKIYHCYSNLAWIRSNIKELHDNNFTSVERIKWTISYIEEQITKAENELDKEDD